MRAILAGLALAVAPAAAVAAGHAARWALAWIAVAVDEVLGGEL